MASLINQASATGTGSVTLLAPVTNSTQTLTLPDATGTLLTVSQQIQPISASAAANALTISAALLSLAFRSATLGSGAVTEVTGTPANMVVPSGATLGTVSAVQSRLVVLALNNAGTIELAVVNIAGGNDLTETGLISTTAISAGSTSASVVYSTTARTSVAYRVIGYIESTQATAGTWATAPSTIQGVGGQALTAMSSLGYGQTWQNVTGSRAFSTTYYNTTGKPIFVVVIGSAGASGNSIAATVNGVLVGYSLQAYAATVRVPTFFIVPPGQSYSVTTGGCSLADWLELR